MECYDLLNCRMIFVPQRCSIYLLPLVLFILSVSAYCHPARGASSPWQIHTLFYLINLLFSQTYFFVVFELFLNYFRSFLP